LRRRDVIVIGASAGGVSALQEIVRGLPKNLPASLFIVLHVTPVARSHLPDLLSRASGLPATTAGPPVRFRPGRIYVAPPDHHLLLSGKEVWAEQGPRENRHRPSINVLFRSAAGALGSRVIGIVLTGIQDDGTAGLAAIKEAGGIAIVQDPREASFPDMPLIALRQVPVDYTLPLREIPETLLDLLRPPLGTRTAKLGKRKSGSRDHRMSRTVKARPSRSPESVRSSRWFRGGSRRSGTPPPG